MVTNTRTIYYFLDSGVDDGELNVYVYTDIGYYYIALQPNREYEKYKDARSVV